jgi:hypothetical protein
MLPGAGVPTYSSSSGISGLWPLVERLIFVFVLVVPVRYRRSVKDLLKAK